MGEFQIHWWDEDINAWSYLTNLDLNGPYWSYQASEACTFRGRGKTEAILEFMVKLGTADGARIIEMN